MNALKATCGSRNQTIPLAGMETKLLMSFFFLIHFVGIRQSRAPGWKMLTQLTWNLVFSYCDDLPGFDTNRDRRSAMADNPHRWGLKCPKRSKKQTKMRQYMRKRKEKRSSQYSTGGKNGVKWKKWATDCSINRSINALKATCGSRNQTIPLAGMETVSSQN